MTISLKEILEDPSKEEGRESLDLAKTWLTLCLGGNLSAPNKVFPQDSVGQMYEKAVKFLETFSKKRKPKLYDLAAPIADAFTNSYYSFTDNLRTGHYAPFPHEQHEYNLAGNNCTTIISEVYLLCEAVGLKPEIMQFFNFRDIITKKDKEEAIAPSHYSLIIEVGRKQKYLLDPFYHTFGPILEQHEHHFKIGRLHGRPARTRTFEKILPYTAKQFVQMIERLHDPAESLDMLVSGQKVFSSKTVAKNKDCTLMVYYQDQENLLSTRLYVPQKPLTDKAIYTRMNLNDEGNVAKLLLECYLAKDYGWDSLVDSKKVCETDFSTAKLLKHKLHRLPKEKFQLQNHERIAPALLRADERNRASLFEITEKMYHCLTEPEQQKLHPIILARTLYESERPAEKYLYTPEEHDARLLKLAKQEMDARFRIQPIKDEIWLHDWKLNKLSKKEAHRLRLVRRGHEEKMSEVVEEINALNYLRHGNKKAYSRAMDKVLFSETLKGKGVEDLEKMVVERNLDPRIGYLAVVADFVPFIIEGQEEVELKQYWQPIKEKVTARMKKKVVQNSNVRSNVETTSDLELAVAE